MASNLTRNYFGGASVSIQGAESIESVGNYKLPAMRPRITMHDTTMQKDAKTVVFSESRSEPTENDSLNDH
jgi:hypothetical protein